MSGTLTKQLVVRVDEPLYAALEADAEANGRTIAQSVRFILKQHLTLLPPGVVQLAEDLSAHYSMSVEQAASAVAKENA